MSGMRPDLTIGEDGPADSAEAEAILRAMIADRPNGLAGPPSPATAEITARDRSAGDELRAAEIRYRALVEQIPAITFLAAMDRGIQEFYVSPQIEAMLGFTQKEWLENPILWYEQLHPDDRDRWQAEFAMTVMGGVPFRSEYRFLARDGRVVWVRGEAQMVRDAEGNPLFLQGIAFDITEQKEAEAILLRGREQLEEEVMKRTRELGEANLALQAEVVERTRADLALRDREARLRSIVDSAVDGIIVIDARGLVEAFNPAAERIFGYPAAEVVGQNINMLMPAPYRAEHDGYLGRYLETGVRKVIGIGRDVTGRRKDGGTFPMELAVSETPTPGGIKFTGIVRDVTERKRGEAALVEAKLAAEAANRLKGEFLANMSHEIRTPMNGILGMTDLALETHLEPDQREYLESVKTSAHALLTLINDILDFSKVEAGKLDLDPVDFDLRETLADALKPMAVRAQEKGLELACEVDDAVPQAVEGDPGRLRQVIINLVGNAIKFTPSGEVVLRVRREPGPDDGLIGFSVADTGIGIPENKHHLIFESFTQADGSTTREFGGTGLGLAICRKLVDLMGGRIALESRPGGGTTFRFTARMPRSRATGHADAAGTTGELAGVPLLIVDDNDTSRRILEAAAIGWGMTPSLADSGLAALEAISRAAREGRAYPIVLLDAAMPGIDGFEVVRRAEADGLPTGTTILMLASAAQLPDLASHRGPGVGLHLIKPVRKSELLATIRHALGHYRGPARPHPPPSPERTPAARGPLRILLVEDGAINQKVAVRLLEKQGHRVVVAEDGRQGLDRLEAGGFDLILMDLQMPVMDGFEALAAIRARESRSGGHIPIIAVTANAMKGDREHCLRAGFDDYVSKPIEWSRLSEAIEGQIGDRPRPPSPEREGPRPAVIFDAETAAGRLDGDFELLKEVAAVFLEECSEMVGQVADAIGRDDPMALMMAAHKLKGCASNFASLAVEDAASRLEQLGSSGETAGAPEEFARLESLLGLLLAGLRRFLGGRDAIDPTGSDDSPAGQAPRPTLSSKCEV